METTNLPPIKPADPGSENQLPGKESLIVSPEGESYLLTTAKWSSFIAIVGFVMIGIMIFASISMFFLSPLMNEYQDFQMFQYMPMPFLFFGIFYLVMAILSFFPYYFLYIFSKKIKVGMINNDQEALIDGLKNLKKLAKFVGIVTIISLALMLLIIPAIIFSIGMMHTIAGGTVV